MNSEYVLAKHSASHFSIALQMPRLPVEFKEGSASDSVFGFSWASFSLSDSVIMEKVRLQGPCVNYLLNSLISLAA